MCSGRYYDVITVAVSILIGIAFAILSFFDLLVTGLTVPVLALALAAGALLILTLGTASLLRQNACYDRCVCTRGARLLISALLLIAVAALTLFLIQVPLVVTLVLIFLTFTLLAFTFFALYCFLSCLIGAGCNDA